MTAKHKTSATATVAVDVIFGLEEYAEAGIFMVLWTNVHLSSFDNTT